MNMTLAEVQQAVYENGGGWLDDEDAGAFAERLEEAGDDADPVAIYTAMVENDELWPDFGVEPESGDEDDEPLTHEELSELFAARMDQLEHELGEVGPGLPDVSEEEARAFVLQLKPFERKAGLELSKVAVPGIGVN
jgi:hypothetical protein